jgi:endonuclease III
VDIHIARASLTLGVVRGKGTWTIKNLFEEIRKTWFESVDGLQTNSRSMIALDVDEPLWHLSKYGCTKRDKETGHCPVYGSCEAKDYCIKGKINVDVGSNMVDLNT